MQKPIIHTDRGSPVYVLDRPWPEDSLPVTKRGIGEPPPAGEFAKFLHALYPVKSCVIVRHKRSTKIFKLFDGGEVYKISARSLKSRDRDILTKQGILQRN